MTTNGPSGSGQPDDPYQRPPIGPDGPSPADPTVPQWGPPPPQPPQWGPPPQPAQWGPPPQPSEWGPPPQPSEWDAPPGPFPPAGPAPGQPAAPWPPQAPGGYGMPPAPPAKRNGGKIALIVALVVLLLVCPCLGLFGWAAWKVADSDSDSAAPAPSLSAPVVPPGLPSDAPSPVLPSPDEEEFAKGDCVVNDGSEDDADLRKVPCAPNTYQVLLRIPATTDGDRCKTLAPQATANYVHDNAIDVFDYVLCLKKR
ncbi:hypothetical protein OG505_27125 [Micromonospora sp. NBC_00617]